MKDVFIIVTGSSLNNICKEEKDYINSCPSICAGHYLLYWELLGIKPNHFVFPGHAWDSPTNGIIPGGLFYGVVEICEHHKLDVDFYVIPETYNYIKNGIIPIHKSGLGKRLKPCKVNNSVKCTAINVSESLHYQSTEVWAHDLKDKFWFNSGIGTAINLATVLYPNSNIKLLGNDGGSSGQYFYNQKESNLDLITLFQKDLKRFAQPRKKSAIPHYNMSFFNTTYAIQKTKDYNCKLFNCNKNSYFTKYSKSKLSDFDKQYLKSNYFYQIPFAPIL
jgi:hypothetical protein